LQEDIVELLSQNIEREELIDQLLPLYPEFSTAEVTSAVDFMIQFPQDEVTPEGKEPIFGKGNFENVDIDTRIAQLIETLGKGPAGVNDTFLREQLIKDGYPSEAVAERTKDFFANIEQTVGNFFGSIFR